MEPIDRDLADLEPLGTDDLIEQRVAALIGRAQSRQIWLLFVDAHDVQLPLVMPISDIPVAPAAGDLAQWAEFIRAVTEAADAASVVVVIERYGSDRLTDADRAWARMTRDGCSGADVDLRAVVLSHRRGVRLLAPEDYA